LCAATIDFPKARIGVIQGTGGNACYRERTANITKLGDISKFPPYMVGVFFFLLSYLSVIFFLFTTLCYSLLLFFLFFMDLDY
jgi:hypothetical protein